MKEKYYSESLNKYFDSAAECLKAEAEFEEKKIAEEKKQNEVSKRKKAMADAIERADIAIEDAYNDLAEAKEKARKIMEESNKEIEEILSAAKKAVTDAENSKIKAISEFNKEFGVYKVSYTGDKAKEAIERGKRSREIFWNSPLISSIFDIFNM